MDAEDRPRQRAGDRDGDPHHHRPGAAGRDRVRGPLTDAHPDADPDAETDPDAHPYLNPDPLSDPHARVSHHGRLRA